MQLTPETLRLLARSSATLPGRYRTSPGDPLAAVLPGDGTEPATDEQIALVNQAISDTGLVREFTAGGFLIRPNIAYLRAELRRWAARTAPLTTRVPSQRQPRLADTTRQR